MDLFDAIITGVTLAATAGVLLVKAILSRRDFRTQQRAARLIAQSVADLERYLAEQGERPLPPRNAP